MTVGPLAFPRHRIGAQVLRPPTPRIAFWLHRPNWVWTISCAAQLTLSQSSVLVPTWSISPWMNPKEIRCLHYKCIVLYAGCNYNQPQRHFFPRHSFRKVLTQQQEKGVERVFLSPLCLAGSLFFRSFLPMVFFYYSYFLVCNSVILPGFSSTNILLLTVIEV